MMVCSIGIFCEGFGLGRVLRGWVEGRVCSCGGI